MCAIICYIYKYKHIYIYKTLLWICNISTVQLYTVEKLFSFSLFSPLLPPLLPSPPPFLFSRGSLTVYPRPTRSLHVNQTEICLSQPPESWDKGCPRTPAFLLLSACLFWLEFSSICQPCSFLVFCTPQFFISEIKSRECFPARQYQSDEGEITQIVLNWVSKLASRSQQLPFK